MGTINGKIKRGGRATPQSQVEGIINNWARWANYGGIDLGYTSPKMWSLVKSTERSDDDAPPPIAIDGASAERVQAIWQSSPPGVRRATREHWCIKPGARDRTRKHAEGGSEYRVRHTRDIKRANAKNANMSEAKYEAAIDAFRRSVARAFDIALPE